MREHGVKGAFTNNNVGRVLEILDNELSGGWEFYSLPIKLVEYVVSLPNHPEPDYVGLGKPQEGWYDTEHGLTVIANGVVYANGVATDADTRCENNGLLIKRPMSSRPGYIGKQEALSFLTDECANNAIVCATNNKIIIVKPGYSETEIESIIVPKLSGSATVIDATNQGGWQQGSSRFVFFDSGKYWFYDMDTPDKLHELPFVNAVKFTIRGDSRYEEISDYLTAQRDDVVTVYKLSTNVTKSFKGLRYAGLLTEDETFDSDEEMDRLESFSFTDKLYNPRNGQYYDVDELFK
jgi:hypothetical protein